MTRRGPRPRWNRLAADDDVAKIVRWVARAGRPVTMTEIARGTRIDMRFAMRALAVAADPSGLAQVKVNPGAGSGNVTYEAPRRRSA